MYEICSKAFPYIIFETQITRINRWDDFYVLNRYLLNSFLGDGDILLNRRDIIIALIRAYN